MLAVLGLMWKFGAMPTYGLRLIWRRDDPNSFDLSIMLMFVLIGGMLAIALFRVWADRNSSRLTREAEQAAAAANVR